MNNVASLKRNNTNSPKTPGGISKSLLTPCRRVGLSRNWKKSGPSPFISPITSSDRNQDNPEENNSPKNSNIDSSNIGVDKTPTRNVALPRKRKSKTLLAVISSSETNVDTQNEGLAIENDDDLLVIPVHKSSEVVNKHTENVESTEVAVSTPVRVKSKGKKKILTQVHTSSQDTNLPQNINDAKECTDSKEVKENISENIALNAKDKSPNDLKKECIVVIQRKIFKDEGKKSLDSINNANIGGKEPQGSTSQTLFDSDSDDMPLCQINKTGSQTTQLTKNEGSQHVIETITINEDDDFIEHKSKIRKIDTPTTKDKQKNIKKKRLETTKIIKQDKPESFDDDEDFDFDNKRTILIRKTYEKVTKPLKAKSTGSITQKDIDELKARIEAKKKMLLAKSITEDTRELRELIKKWQKGCQDALMELMDLMKRKFPEKSNMDYSEILETLHIPASLVGYDSENDCFNTPDDKNIILSHVL